MKPTSPDLARRSAGNWPDEAGDGTMKQKLEEDARDAKREVGTKVREEAEAGQQRLADEADALSDAIDAAATNLADHDRAGLARYAREMSSKLAAAAGQLEGRSVDELADDAKQLARKNPALFMLGSVAVGFALSRFLKASEKQDRDDSQETTDGNGAAAAPPVRRPDTRMNEPYVSSDTPRSSDGRVAP